MTAENTETSDKSVFDAGKKIRDRRKRLYQIHRIENVERARLYRKRNKQAITDRRRRHYQQNKNKILLRNMDWRHRRRRTMLAEYSDCDSLSRFFSNLSKGLRAQERDERHYNITSWRSSTTRICYACGKDKSTADLRDNFGRWYANPIGLDKLTSWYNYIGKEILWLCNSCYNSIWLSRFAVFAILNKYRCERCGESDLIVLQLDHVKGGGSYEREIRFKGLKNMYRFYIRNPEIAKKQLQILCANCNIRKMYDSGEIYKKYIPLE